MELRAGQKLISAVSDTEVIVVKAPEGSIEIACGGVAMRPDGTDAPDGATLDASLGDGPLLGKRYALDELGLELLCTRAGDGALYADGSPVPVKEAKPLPSSD